MEIQRLVRLGRDFAVIFYGGTYLSLRLRCVVSEYGTFDRVLNGRLSTYDPGFEVKGIDLPPGIISFSVTSVLPVVSQ